MYKIWPRSSYNHALREKEAMSIRVRKKGSFGKGVFLRKAHFLEIPENLENPQIVENTGESDHVLEILENLEILEILEIPRVKRPLS